VRIAHCGRFVPNEVKCALNLLSPSATKSWKVWEGVVHFFFFNYQPIGQVLAIDVWTEFLDAILESVGASSLMPDAVVHLLDKASHLHHATFGTSKILEECNWASACVY